MQRSVKKGPYVDEKLLKRIQVKRTLRTIKSKVVRLNSRVFWDAISKFQRPGAYPGVIDKRERKKESCTPVDAYWGYHTVFTPPFKTAWQSKLYIQRRLRLYPLWKEFMELYRKHDNKIILDYGCGPGHDLVGFALYSRARKSIGIDVSEKALNLAAHRISLHHIHLSRVELILTEDSASTIPLDNQYVDYIYCEGVLHHTSNPKAILDEFYRIMKDGGYACVMVYNRESLWLHLYVAYYLLVLQKAFPGVDAYQAFPQTTDGVECPISRCYGAEEFIPICNSAGFEAEYVGGFFNDSVELFYLKALWRAALQDERLADVHRNFLRDLVLDERGFPRYGGKHAGICGVYRLCKK